MKSASRNRFATLCTLLLAASAAPAAVIQGPVTNIANKHVYYLLSESIWTVAEAEAVSLGGHLATVRNDAENTWILNTFNGFDDPPRRLWIGLNDAAQEGLFVWSSGEDAPYRHWAFFAPDNCCAGEDYVHIYDPSAGGVTGFWNDFCDCTPESGVRVHGVVEVIPTNSPPVLSTRVSQVQVCWASSSNQAYQVQYRSALTPNAWAPLVQCVPGNGTTNCIYDAVTVGQPQRFYRVVATNCVPLR